MPEREHLFVARLSGPQDELRAYLLEHRMEPQGVRLDGTHVMFRAFLTKSALDGLEGHKSIKAVEMYDATARQLPRLPAVAERNRFEREPPVGLGVKRR